MNQKRKPEKTYILKLKYILKHAKIILRLHGYEVKYEEMHGN